MTTGPLHWELLQRARASDNQLFVAAVSPARGDDPTGYVAWGHTTLSDPWGKVIGKLDEKEGILLTEIDLEEIKAIRQQIPITTQKRGDMYKLENVKPLE